MTSFKSIAVRSLGLIAATAPFATAQEPADPAKTEIEQLRQQVQDLTTLVKDLQKKVETQPAAAPLPIPPPSIELTEPPVSQGPTAPELDLATNLAADPLPPPRKSEPGLFNPEISAAIDAIGSYSSSADNLNFIARDIEVMIQSNVDQVARAYAVFNAETELEPSEKSSAFEEVSLGVEEAAIETTSLPYGLAVKAGQFFADFSRLGKVHSHELPFTDRPASLESIIGGETKSRGVEANWVPPVDHYFRFTAGAVDNIGAEPSSTEVYTDFGGSEQNLFGDRSNRSFRDLTYYGRVATIFELGDCASINIGADYSHGQETSERQLASADFKLTWTPDASSFDRLEVGGEFLTGKSEGDFQTVVKDSGSSTSRGAYLYAQYRVGKKWEPGIRYDWFRPDAWSEVDSDSDGVEDSLARSHSSQNTLSAYLTYNLSELNRLRIGLSHVNGESGAYSGKDHDWLGYLQWSIIIGSHKHSFQP
jgi:hypothetical protein